MGSLKAVRTLLDLDPDPDLDLDPDRNPGPDPNSNPGPGGLGSKLSGLDVSDGYPSFLHMCLLAKTY